MQRSKLSRVARRHLLMDVDLAVISTPRIASFVPLALKAELFPCGIAAG
jgi:hypothetical protein